MHSNLTRWHRSPLNPCAPTRRPDVSDVDLPNATSPTLAGIAILLVGFGSAGQALAVSPFPSLPEATAAATRAAPAAREAEANLQLGKAAKTGAAISRWGNPQLEIRGDRGNKNITVDVFMQVNLMWPVELADQPGKRRAEADSVQQALHAAQRASLADVRAAVTAAWGSVAVGGERIAVLERMVETAAAEAESLQKRAALGDVRKPDALQAEVERARTLMILQEERARLQATLADLESMTNLDLSDARLPDAAPEPALPALPASWRPPARDAALAEASMLRASELRLREEAKPPLTLMVTSARGDFGEYRLGAGVFWTIAGPRKNQGERARALAAARSAEVRADAAQRAAEARVRNLIREWDQLQEARTALRATAVPGAKAAEYAAEATAAAGKGERTAVWLARRTTLELQLRELGLKERQWQIAGELLRLVAAETAAKDEGDK